jgi:hypothetical protein
VVLDIINKGDLIVAFCDDFQRMFVVLTRQVQAYDVKAVVEKGGENA